MNIKDFLRTIYLGDRACKAILIDSWNGTIKIQVDCISRIRSETWNYYNDENIEDGWIVFNGVQSCSFDPSGPIPNDLIDGLEFEGYADHRSTAKVLIKIAAVHANADEAGFISQPGCYVNVRITAQSIHLEDPKRPGIQIIE